MRPKDAATGHEPNRMGEYPASAKRFQALNLIRIRFDAKETCYKARTFQTPAIMPATRSPRPTWHHLVLVTLLALGAYAWWQHWSTGTELDGVVSGNGRLEATPIDIATRIGGRISEVLVHEGDDVQVGQVLVRMDTRTLQAETARAQAAVQQAEQARITAQAMVAQRQQAILTASAVVAQRQSTLDLAQRQWERTQQLVQQGFLSPQKLDEARAQEQGARAALAVAQSQVAEARTGLATAQAQIIETEGAIEAAKASLQRAQADLSDSDLKAPRPGRVQVRAAQPGEVVGAGARVLSMVDLSDVHMSFFLPEAAAGRLSIGSEARLVLDAAPQYVIPATISFVASVAQFTPKTVETASERQKLVFKVRAQVAPALLDRHRSHVKTGLPGVAYVRQDPSQPWPDRLAVKLPPVPADAAPPAASAASAEPATSQP